jgi:glutamyl-tRNA synthetase
MSKEIRVRFAPSPTGPLHIGGVRTALFNYLFAKKNNGKMILRIEDTDQTRFVPGAEEYIKKSLEWTGIKFDEGIDEKGDFGPYKQSERKAIYAKYIQELLDKDKAYYAFDTPESLEKIRKEYEAKGERFMYNYATRKDLNNSIRLNADEVAEKLKNRENYVIRFKIPENQEVEMQDIIRGKVIVNSNTLDDKVLMKSDGLPTYHLANIVDDHLMKISHVIRGEEWLPSLPLHYLLYEAFGWNKPEFAHLPLIMKPVGKGKLSKRDGAKMGFPVFPMEWKDPKTGEIYAGYKEDGYFPESFVNLLALLGWNPGTEQEIFTMKELIKIFDLSKVNKSGAKFDPEKAKWFQHQHLQRKSTEELVDLFIPVLNDKLGYTVEGKAIRDYTSKVINLLKERTTFVADFWEQGSFFYQAPTEYAAKAVKKQWKEQTPVLMNEVGELLQKITDFSAGNIKEKLSEWINAKEIGFGKVMQPLRLSLVGDLKGPDLFVIMEMLGKDEVIRRINTAVEKLTA